MTGVSLLPTVADAARMAAFGRKQLSQLTIDKFSLPQLVAIAKDFREKVRGHALLFK